MNAPDILITWPKNVDYPLWRQMIRDNRKYFTNIVIIFMETNAGVDYREFIRESMLSDNVNILESPMLRPGEDWRDVAINFGLFFIRDYSRSEWVWFTEQDFFPLDGFFEEVYNLMESHMDYIGVKEGERLHPCCLFARKDIINRTSRNFGIIPNISDHFSMIQKDLEKMNINRALCSPDKYEHMAGLTHNMTLLERGEAPNHDVTKFYLYLKKCMEVEVPLAPHFKKLYEIYVG